MHLVGDQQRLPAKQRTKAEKLFKRINTFIIAAHLACYLIDLSAVVIATPKTFTNTIWGVTDFGLKPVLDAKTGNCSHLTVDRVRGFADTPLNITGSNHAIIFTELAVNVRFCMIVTAVAVVLSAANKMVYDFNIFEVKLGRSVVLHKEVLTLTEFIFLIMSIQSATEAELYASDLRGYLVACGVTSESSLPFAVPFVAIYVATGVVLGLHVISFLIHLRNTLSETPPTPGKIKEDE